MSDILDLIKKEEQRQAATLMLIPSENYTYPEVREAVGSVLMHKYSEGYPGKRYYQGNEFIDEIETSAIESAKKLFGVPHANVQPLSGSPANAAVYMALLNPGDTIMGLSLSAGGHLTHGHPITFSGKFFKSVQFGVTEDGLIDFDAYEEVLKKEKPKLIMLGISAYPRLFDFERFARLADESGALLVADIAHIVGLVVTGLHPNPVPYVHVVTTTTHKMLRGPRGALILVTEKGLERDPEMAKKIDRAVFPGLQGGPHNNVTAGIAITLQKAATPKYAEYTHQIVKNAKVLSEELLSKGFELVTGGTDNHLLLIDVRNKSLTGKEAAVILEKAGIVANANAIPFDPAGPLNPSGIRIGTPAVTARGMKEDEMKSIAEYIESALTDSSEENLVKIAKEVETLCKEFPLS